MTRILLKNKQNMETKIYFQAVGSSTDDSSDSDSAQSENSEVYLMNLCFFIYSRSVDGKTVSGPVATGSTVGRRRSTFLFVKHSIKINYILIDQQSIFFISGPNCIGCDGYASGD